MCRLVLGLPDIAGSCCGCGQAARWRGLLTVLSRCSEVVPSEGCDFRAQRSGGSSTGCPGCTGMRPAPDSHCPPVRRPTVSGEQTLRFRPPPARPPSPAAPSGAGTRATADWVLRWTTRHRAWPWGGCRAPARSCLGLALAACGIGRRSLRAGGGGRGRQHHRGRRRRTLGPKRLFQ